MLVALDRSDQLAQSLFRLTGALLQTTEEFLVLAFHEKKIVVGKAGVFLFEFAGEFVPGAFEGEFGHKGLLNGSCVWFLADPGRMILPIRASILDEYPGSSMIPPIPPLCRRDSRELSANVLLRAVAPRMPWQRQVARSDAGESMPYF